MNLILMQRFLSELLHYFSVSIFQLLYLTDRRSAQSSSSLQEPTFRHKFTNRNTMKVSVKFLVELHFAVFTLFCGITCISGVSAYVLAAESAQELSQIHKLYFDSVGINWS